MERVRSFWSLLEKAQKTFKFLWSVYSKPAPRSALECLALLLQCLFIAVLTGGLLFTWMYLTLKYKYQASCVVAGMYASVCLFILFLVHPVRCMFTMIIPSLGTKQGRKLIISTAMMLLVLHCIPNIVTNIKTIFDIIKCSTQTTTEKTLNSTIILNSAISDFNKFFQNIPAIQKAQNNLNFKGNINISEINKKLDVISEGVKQEFHSVELILRTSLEVIKKVVAGLLLLYLLAGSVWYLIGYLTDIKYDNLYVTEKLRSLAEEHGRTDALLSYDKKLVKSTGLRMSRHEVLRALRGIVILAVYGVIAAVIIGLDHFVFFLLGNILEWAHDFPEVDFSISAKLSVKIGVRGVNEVNNFFNDAVNFFGGDGSKAQIPTETHMDKNYEFGIPLLSENCLKKLSPPHSSIAVTVGVLHLVAFVMLVGEVYARRARRKISASFYKQREEERVNYLFQKIIEKEME
ncbi:osteoclast stimulatory transmembrane protein-like [Acipenser ruthenus]|uniref:osteoclast stimulatory transmembrane protein-like n=1 Tax=Acipenser ruthenus TaxID=7906 RepID=UPI00145BA4BB|nr:osteoclast stimulatory transmembrane protein-like [Acipenser ruthenus]